MTWSLSQRKGGGWVFTASDSKLTKWRDRTQILEDESLETHLGQNDEGGGYTKTKTIKTFKALLCNCTTFKEKKKYVDPSVIFLQWDTHICSIKKLTHTFLPLKITGKDLIKANNIPYLTIVTAKRSLFSHGFVIKYSKLFNNDASLRSSNLQNEVELPKKRMDSNSTSTELASRLETWGK